MKEVRIYSNGKIKKISYPSKEDIKNENVYLIQKTRSKKKKEKPFTISKLNYKNKEFSKTKEKYITEIKLDSKNIYLFEIGLFIDIYNNIFKNLENKDLEYIELAELINDNEKVLHNKNSVKKEVRKYREYHKNKLLEGYELFDTIHYKLEMLIIAYNINYYYENKLQFEDIKTILYATDDKAKIHLDSIKYIESNKKLIKQLEKIKKALKLNTDLLPPITKKEIHTIIKIMFKKK